MNLSKILAKSIVIHHFTFYRACEVKTGNLNIYRVCTGPGKPGKSWNFIMAFSRAGKSWKKATGPGKFWKSVNSAKNMKCMGSSKEN